MLRFGDLPDGNISTLAIEIPLSGLDIKPDPDTSIPTAHLAIVAQVRDESGVVIEHAAEDVLRRNVRDTLAHDPSATINLNRHFISVPGKYTLESAIVDRNNGHTSARRTEFEIEPAASPLLLSDIVLVRRLEPHYAEQEDPLEPLRYEHQKSSPIWAVS